MITRFVSYFKMYREWGYDFTTALRNAWRKA